MNGQPLWIVIVGAILGTGGTVGGVGAIIGAWMSRSVGVKANERQARADELDAEDRLVQRWQQAAESDRQRADRLERDLLIEREYSRMLQDWIWRSKSAPPPARPEIKGE